MKVGYIVMLKMKDVGDVMFEVDGLMYILDVVEEVGVDFLYLC